MNENAIEIKGLEKAFKNVKVLRGIDLTVKRGSIFALLGSNGAGKTTTIRILSTLLKADKGEAKVYGYDVQRQPERVREVISLTGQNTAVDNVLTGRENLRMIGKLRHLSDAKQQADALLERFSLTDAADRKVAAYSGGMRRRLDLAMGLLGSPMLMFLDEPTTGLDPQSRIAMWNIIKGLGADGTTVFLTTQYLEEAERLADHIAILDKGVIVAQGSADELKKMLPHSHIELKFISGGDMRAAEKLLSDFEVTADEQNFALSVKTNGSVKDVTRVLSLLENAVTVTEFSLKQPTLEDVFLSIVENEKNEEEAV